MQLIVKLKDSAKAAHATRAPARPVPDDVQHIAVSSGESIRPLHPGTADAALATYFVIDVRDPAQVDTLIRRLLQSPLVDAAYAKPPDALP